VCTTGLNKKTEIDITGTITVKHLLRGQLGPRNEVFSTTIEELSNQ
jgi:hypothetical protein